MIQASIEQLFDVTADPGAKQRLLGGVSNFARCPYCGYQGRLATPIVYHDNDKELLLTYFPPELAMPLNEQERLIGPLIKQVTDRLPPEKRKGYLLSPRANLTYESMIETILGKDGITPEMIKAQQERLQVIERLMQVSARDARSELIKQNAGIIDDQFFALFSRIAQSAVASGQESAARGLIDIQTQLLEETEYGRQLKETVGELEAAQTVLQEAGQSLTREKLLDFVLESKTDARLRAYVSLARPGMDYLFFQTLSEKIEKAGGEEKKRLEEIRAKLLQYVDELDKQIEARFKQAQQFIESILARDDIEQATQESLDAFTQEAVEIVQQMLRQASEKNDYTRMGKLQKMVQVLQAASAPPPEVALIEKLIQAPDDAAIETMLKENDALVTQQLLDTLTGLAVQMESQNDNPEAKAMGERLGQVHRVALKYSMKKNLG
jgi:hypothetical protein